MEYIFFGLGNGEEYFGTRHNIGEDFLLSFVENKKGKWSEIDNYFISTISVGSHIISCVLTKGGINESGEKLKNFLKATDNKRLLVFQDEVDLEVGKIVFSYAKNSAGHRGIDNLIKILGSNNFYRVRIGIGKDNNNNMNKFVIDKFKKDELEKILSEMKNKMPEIIEEFFKKVEKK